MAVDPRQIPVSELENKNLDRSVSPEVMVRGMMGKDSAGDWQYLLCNSSGEIIVDTTNLDSRYVLKTGDTMTGALHIERTGGAGYDVLYLENKDGTDCTIYFDGTGASQGIIIWESDNDKFVIGDTFNITNNGNLFMDAGAEIYFRDTNIYIDSNADGELTFHADGVVKSVNKFAITPANGTADPLFQVLTTGTAQYGIRVDTYDLSGIGYGKYPYLRGATNGIVSNLMVMGPVLIGDSYQIPGTGQALGFFNETTLASLVLIPDWDNSWIQFPDTYVNGTLLVDTFNPTTLTIGNNTAATTTLGFDSLNYDGSLNFYDNSSGGGVAYWFGNAGLTGAGVSSCRLDLPGTRIQAYNRGYNYIDLADSADYRFYYNGYVVTSENSGATAHYFTAIGTNLPADGFFCKFLHMSDPGVIFSVDDYGDMVIGSTTTTVDHDTSLTFGGKDNTWVATFDQSADILNIADNTVILSDSKYLGFGASNDAKIYYDGTNLQVDTRVVGSGNLIISDFIRSNGADYRRYYHLSIDSFNPGASGATWTTPSANTTGGYQLDAAGEILYFDTDVHADWDGSSDMVVEVYFAVNVDNTGGLVTDTVDLKLVAYYNAVGDTVCKTQTQEVATVVGQSAQYKVFKSVHTINWDETDNVVEVGDKIGFALNLETDTSEVDNVIITHASFYYNTTHVGIESGDV